MSCNIKLINPYHHFTFLSPHLDDAVLSAGSLMSLLVNAGKTVQVITLFTKPSLQKNTCFTRQFIRESGFDDAGALFAARYLEDRQAMAVLGIDHYVYLPYIDAAWRHYHDSHAVFKGKIHPGDKDLIADITTTLHSLVNPDTVLLTPLGIGNHVDHIITSQCAQSLNTKKRLYWADHPYLAYTSLPSLPQFSLSPHPTKITASNCYQSQLKAMASYYDPTIVDEHYYSFLTIST